jgi:signal transduction histidine kinase
MDLQRRTGHETGDNSLSNLLLGVHRVHRVLVQGAEPSVLASDVCSTLTAHLDGASSWAALHDPSGAPHYVACARHGRHDPAAAAAVMNAGDLPACAVRAKETDVLTHRASAPHCVACPHQDMCAGDVRLTARLAHEDRIYGTIGVAGDWQVEACEQGRQFFCDLAADMALAIHRWHERQNAQQTSRDLARFPAENPNPVLRVDAEGRLTYCNDAALPITRAWQCSSGDMVPQEIRQLATKALQSGKAAHTEVAAGPKAYLLSVAPLTDKCCVNLYGMDVTQHHRLEMHLRQQQKLESIGTLAGGVAHEINNPINGVMNYAQLIKDELEGTDAESITQYADEIIRETERVATIVRNLLQFARHEKESHSPACVEDIVNGTLSLIRTVFRHDQITLDIHIPENLPKIKCRSQQIQQVVMNLMANARDALNARYPGYDENKTVRLDVSRFNRDGRRWVRIAVEDHGIGIPPNIRDRIFDPFFTTKSRDVGTGLGLAISHGIVTDHHGELTVQSKVGEYTRFLVDLPIDNGWELEVVKDS